MLTREEDKFTRLAIDLNSENKGKYFDIEFNNIIDYIQKVISPKLKSIETVSSLKSILGEGAKNQVLKVLNNRLVWGDINTDVNELVQTDYTNLHCENHNGILLYNENRLQSFAPDSDGEYYVKINRNGCDFIRCETAEVFYDRTHLTNNIINDYKYYLDEDLENVLLYTIGLDNKVFVKEVNETIIKTITKSELEKWKSKLQPGEKDSRLFRLNYLDNGKFRNPKKIKNFFNFFNKDPKKLVDYNYHNNNNEMYIKYIESLIDDRIKNFNKDTDSDNEGELCPTVSTYDIGVMSTTNFTENMLRNSNSFIYNRENLYKNFVFMQVKDVGTPENECVYNNRIIEFGKTFKMKYYDSKAPAEPVRDFDFDWEGCQGNNYEENCIELEDIKLSFDDEIYQAFMNYINSKD